MSPELYPRRRPDQFPPKPPVHATLKQSDIAFRRDSQHIKTMSDGFVDTKMFGISQVINEK